MSSEEGRLARWARRKAEARKQRGGAAPVLEKDAGEKPLPGNPGDQPLAEATPAEAVPEGLDLPDIESLTAESDFSPFMKDGVPAALRRLALRKLWSSDPMFNIIDEMVEYGEDYTNAAMIVEGMKSAWEPGRGYGLDEKKPAESDETGTTKSDESGEEDIGKAEDEETGRERKECLDTPVEESEGDPELG